MDLHQSCILVVDDNESVRELLHMLLEARGHNVALAKNGQEALEIMSRSVIDLVLLDIMMPVMDGYDVLRWMRAKPELSSKPVVVLTALNDTDSIIKCIELGADDYLFKPINRAILMARVDASVEKKRLRDVEHKHIMELAILQQIDRELNASLDLSEVARITLGWAMRQTGSRGGLIGLLDDGKLTVLHAEGCIYAAQEVVPISALGVHVVPNGRLQETILPPSEQLTADFDHRIAVSIHREKVISCLMLLENQGPFAPDSIGFLSRLRDHAAIALANAQLHLTAQEANRAKSDFISFVSHELKTPIAIIRNYAELMVAGKSGPINEKQTRFLENIRANVVRMKELVSDLDDISRIEAGRLRLNFEKVALDSVLDEVIKSIEQQIIHKQQNVHAELDIDLPLIRADRFRLSQILTNLLSNANKYAPEQSDIYVRATVVPYHETTALQIEVEDAGMGIRDTDKHHIFKQFFRSADQDVRAIMGTGLGLNIAKRLVELHDGEIWFESEYGVGTTFYFTIPAVQTAVSMQLTSIL
ncbi:MAG: hybrid sensor histidine kinase/response regulator [Chloroflexota bacterium]